MKICLINNLYKPFNRGGADRITEILAEGLFKKGHAVFVIATKPLFLISHISYLITRTYYISNLFYYLNRVPVIIRFIWHLIDMFDIGTYYKVRKILKKEKPGIVITNNLKGLSYLIPFLLRRKGIKHIHILHDIQLIHPSGLMYFGEEAKIDGYLAHSYSRICAWLFGSPEAVISPSKWLMRMHVDRNFFPGSIKRVIRNPIADLPSSTLRKESDGVFRFIYSGQLEKHKGIDLLLTAFINLAKKNKNIELILLGKGSMADTISNLCRGRKNIILAGWITGREEYFKFLSNADCLVMPSVCYENSPAVLYEAAALGLPFIASDLGGAGELVEEYGGTAFRAGDAADLAAKMDMVIRNKSKYENAVKSNQDKVRNLQIDNYLKELQALF